MVQNGLHCSTWEFGMGYCRVRNPNWVANKYCQRSCAAAGYGYDGDNCCTFPTDYARQAAKCTRDELESLVLESVASGEPVAPSMLAACPLW